MALFVVENLDHHILRNVVHAFGLFHEPGVVLDGASLGFYDAFYYAYHVYLVFRRHQGRLDGLELHRAGHDTVEFFDPRGELLGVH